MDYEQIKKIIDDMGEAKIDELSIEFPEGIKISMKKHTAAPQPQVAQEIKYVQMPQEKVEKIDEEKEEEKQEKNYKEVKAPMVGTFYSKSSPTAEPYVKVGSKVKKGDILCIIEAMKLMNEIESEYDGEIEEICVNDGDMVDYGKPLFKIK